MADQDWPLLARTGRWPATQDYLHLVVQMLGKLRLALAPAQPEWFGTPLTFAARGLTTGTLPRGTGSVEAVLDLADHVIAVLASDGATRTIDFVPARPIAEIWAEYSRALRDLEIVAPLWDKPQERSDATPFSEDSRPRDYDPALGAAWFGLLTRLHAEFDVWRSPFFGRTGVGFWWGGFDLSAVLFSGRHAVPRAGADYIMRYDLDAEQLVVGFWPGNDEREAQFFAYLVPEPTGCDEYPLEESAAGWAPALGEWILPYDAVRTAAEPHRVLRAFMGAMYQAAGTLGGWDLDQFTYARPPGYRATSASVDTVDSPTEDVSRRPSSGTGGSDEHDSAE